MGSKDKEPAFPRAYMGQEGMTHRQWLAGLAMQGLLASNRVYAEWETLVRQVHEVADAQLAFEAKERGDVK